MPSPLEINSLHPSLPGWTLLHLDGGLCVLLDCGAPGPLLDPAQLAAVTAVDFGVVDVILVSGVSRLASLPAVLAGGGTFRGRIFATRATVALATPALLGSVVGAASTFAPTPTPTPTSTSASTSASTFTSTSTPTPAGVPTGIPAGVGPAPRSSPSTSAPSSAGGRRRRLVRPRPRAASLGREAQRHGGRGGRPWTLREAAACARRMTGLSYGETARLGDTVTVTPRSSGEYVGAANWHFEVNAGATHPSVALLGCAGGKGGKGGGGGGGRVAGRGGGALSQGSAGLASPAPFSAVYVTCGRGWSRPALLRWRHPLGLHEQSRTGADSAGGGGSSGGGKRKEPQRVELACGALIFPDVYCGEQDGERAAGPGAGLVRVLRSSRRHPQLEQSGGHERSNTRIDESKEGKESTGENTKGSESRNGPVSSADTTGQPQQQSAPRRQKKEKEATALDAALESCAYVESVIHRGGKVRYYWTRPIPVWCKRVLVLCVS